MSTYAVNLIENEDGSITAEKNENGRWLIKQNQTQDEFLNGCSTWNNHLVFMWLALEATKDNKLPVAEFGSGSSTPILRQYCLDNNRPFVSFDNNKEWAEKTGSTFIEDWDTADIYKDYSVVLIDEAPGEHRHKTAAILKDKAVILTLHDSETNGGGQYFYEKIFPLFQHRVNLNKTEGGAGASAISNHFNVTIWDGIELAGFKITL